MQAIILRQRRSATRGGSFGMRPSEAGIEATMETGVPPEEEAPEISFADLDEREMEELERSPEFMVVRPMPLRPIQPVERERNGEPLSGDALSDFTRDTPAGPANWGIDDGIAGPDGPDGAGVRVAILDTGIDENHPAFTTGGLRITQRNFTDEADGDTNGHGTHCAGTIFGRDVDGVRIGVARGVRDALVGKVLPGTLQDLIMALEWARNEAADIISMSLGYDFPGWVDFLVTQHGMPIQAATSQALRDYRRNVLAMDAVLATMQPNRFSTHGTLVLAAAGNESNRGGRGGSEPYVISVAPPAVADTIIAVAALQQGPDGLEVADFSNTDPDLSAPGVDIVSAMAGTQGLTALSGTSMACPHAAGMAALYWQKARDEQRPRLATTVRRQMEGRADRSALAPGWRTIDIGQGMVVAP